MSRHNVQMCLCQRTTGHTHFEKPVLFVILNVERKKGKRIQSFPKWSLAGLPILPNLAGNPSLKSSTRKKAQILPKSGVKSLSNENSTQKSN